MVKRLYEVRRRDGTRRGNGMRERPLLPARRGDHRCDRSDAEVLATASTPSTNLTEWASASCRLVVRSICVEGVSGEDRSAHQAHNCHGGIDHCPASFARAIATRNLLRDWFQMRSKMNCIAAVPVLVTTEYSDLLFHDDFVGRGDWFRPCRRSLRGGQSQKQLRAPARQRRAPMLSVSSQIIGQPVVRKHRSEILYQTISVG